MFIEIIIFSLLGIVAGTVAGLIPGLHPNTIIFILFGALPLLTNYPVHAIITFLISMAVTNTLVSFIPAVFLGAPEDATALSVLPAHRLLLEGKGLEAVYLTVVGGLGVVLIFTVMLPLWINILPILYANVKNYIPFLLIGIVSIMILTEKGIQKLWAIIVFGLSSILGLIVLNSYLVQPHFVFFPLFSGLFGTSTLLISLKGKTKLINQIKDFGFVSKSLAIIGSIKGFLSGLIVGILPAVGSAQAGTFVQVITRKEDIREFLVSLGGINTAQALFSLTALYAISKPRSGVAVAVDRLVENFGFNELMLLTGVALIVTGIGSLLTLFLSKIFLSILEKISYRKISIFVIALIAILTAIFTGIYGLLILTVATAIGLLAPLTNVKRSLLMGVLITPTIFLYLGFI